MSLQDSADEGFMPRKLTLSLMQAPYGLPVEIGRQVEYQDRWSQWQVMDWEDLTLTSDMRLLSIMAPPAVFWLQGGLNYWAALIHGKLPAEFLGRANVIRNKRLSYNFVLYPSVSHCASLLGKKRWGWRFNCTLNGFEWQGQVFRGSKAVCLQRTGTKKILS